MLALLRPPTRDTERVDDRVAEPGELCWNVESAGRDGRGGVGERRWCESRSGRAEREMPRVDAARLAGSRTGEVSFGVRLRSALLRGSGRASSA